MHLRVTCKGRCQQSMMTHIMVKFTRLERPNPSPPSLTVTPKSLTTSLIVTPNHDSCPPATTPQRRPKYVANIPNSGMVSEAQGAIIFGRRSVVLDLPDRTLLHFPPGSDWPKDRHCSVLHASRSTAIVPLVALYTTDAIMVGFRSVNQAPFWAFDLY